MKFSGHETFPIREGWLHKGLKLLDESPDAFLDEEVSDLLGVGRNMAKSIRHWLLAADLAEIAGSDAGGRKQILQMTELGQLIWKNDPYFVELGTWWILHSNLVRQLDKTTTWSWFFNHFSHDRFDRAVCLESLRRFVESSRKRVPSTATLARDLGCMLLGYARSIPGGDEDPEDGADCPFRELGLVSYYRTSGYYQVHRKPKRVPPEIFGYVLSNAFPEILLRSSQTTDIKIVDAARQPNSPGRVFCLGGESLFESVSNIEAISDGLIQIAGMAGDRVIRFKVMPSYDWAIAYYETCKEATCV